MNDPLNQPVHYEFNLGALMMMGLGLLELGRADPEGWDQSKPARAQVVIALGRHRHQLHDDEDSLLPSMLKLGQLLMLNDVPPKSASEGLHGRRSTRPLRRRPRR